MPNFANTKLPTKAELLSVINLYLQSSSSILATEHNEIETALVNAVYGGQVGDIKELAVNSQYITDNFTSTGLGKSTGERYGWAICNGQNGTIDKRGNVSVGYDPGISSYADLASLTSGGGPTPYKQGGEKNVTLLESQIPPHRHKFSDDTNGDTNTLRSGNDIIPFATNPTSAGISADGSGSGKIYQTSRTGGTNNVTQSHENMQPYIVTLFIQRIDPY